MEPMKLDEKTQAAVDRIRKASDELKTALYDAAEVGVVAEFAMDELLVGTQVPRLYATKLIVRSTPETLPDTPEKPAFLRKIMD